MRIEWRLLVLLLFFAQIKLRLVNINILGHTKREENYFYCLEFLRSSANLGTFHIINTIILQQRRLLFNKIFRWKMFFRTSAHIFLTDCFVNSTCFLNLFIFIIRMLFSFWTLCRCFFYLNGTTYFGIQHFAPHQCPACGLLECTNPILANASCVPKIAPTTPKPSNT